MGIGVVASYGALRHVPPSSFGNSVHSVAAHSLTVKISKITKEKHALNFHISRQKHAKTDISRLKQSWKLEPKKSRVGEERKKSYCTVLSSVGSWERRLNTTLFISLVQRNL